ncbi:MAG: fused MFS/spermidine synthase [Acidimicrobiales bacterium]
MPTDPPSARPLPPPLAVGLVVTASASVLILEILAGRLLAPYVGVSIETYTGIIGTVLAGIAIGAWLGGTLADRYDPRRLLPLLFVLSGALALIVLPVVRTIGGAGGPGAPGSGAEIIVLTALGFLPSATVLSAVPPAVVKLQLRDLDRAGATVGTLSGWSTGGAIIATFFTGFVLVRWAAVTTLVVAVGLVLIVLGFALALLGRPGTRPAEATNSLLAPLALGALGLTGVVAIDSPCQTETAYYCASVVADPDPAHPSRRTLVLDDLRHSTIDLDDPTYLGFWYIRRLADAVRNEAPDGTVDVVHLGGGGFTLPRWLRAVRPGSEQKVLEIDPKLVELVERDLGFPPGPDVEVITGDGRLSLRALPDDSADVIIGDAFGSRAVPWHLATREFLTDVRRVLRPDGVYAANIIDGPEQRFLRAEAATLAAVFDHVEVILGPLAVDGQRGNSIIYAADEPIDTAAIDAVLIEGAQGGRRITDLDAFLAGVDVLTDDHAPVDQLLSGSA